MTSSLDKETVRRMIDEFYRIAEQPDWSGEVNEGREPGLISNTINRLFIILIFLMSIAACCSLDNIQDFVFYDAAGNVYNSGSVENDFFKAFSRSYRPNMVLILTPSIDDANYKEQMEKLYKVKNLEERSIIFITASLDEKYAFGYHTDIGTTLSLFSDKPREFRVILLSDKWRFLSEATEPLSSLDIEKSFPLKDCI